MAFDAVYVVFDLTYDPVAPISIARYLTSNECCNKPVDHLIDLGRLNSMHTGATAPVDWP